ncbi:hypothetical protein E2C01_048772 [Portunus trituberculatus]|uniref:Uncharacterized protein n=1 Tax=Portunus trituberculatus TaxID=210409 RepID=A0A5B7G4L4_PORTR|nr:hypothetical protein [Portunus trituberculatus]
MLGKHYIITELTYVGRSGRLGCNYSVKSFNSGLDLFSLTARQITRPKTDPTHLLLPSLGRSRRALAHLRRDGTHTAQPRAVLVCLEEVHGAASRTRVAWGAAGLEGRQAAAGGDGRGMGAEKDGKSGDGRGGSGRLHRIPVDWVRRKRNKGWKARRKFVMYQYNGEEEVPLDGASTPRCWDVITSVLMLDG